MQAETLTFTIGHKGYEKARKVRSANRIKVQL